MDKTISRETNKQTMKILYTTTNSGDQAPGQSDQSSKHEMQTGKYIVIIWNCKEQVVTFPNRVQHADILHYIRRESPQVQAVSAGFFIAGSELLWTGGRSETLDLDSRPQDKEMLKAFLRSPERAQWDLTVLKAKGGAI